MQLPPSSVAISPLHSTRAATIAAIKADGQTDATEGGLDVGTKGEASLHIARWKEGEREQLVSLPPKISALAKANDDATFRDRIDEVGNRDRYGGSLPFSADARFSN